MRLVPDPPQLSCPRRLQVEVLPKFSLKLPDELFQLVIHYNGGWWGRQHFF